MIKKLFSTALILTSVHIFGSVANVLASDNSNTGLTLNALTGHKEINTTIAALAVANNPILSNFRISNSNKNRVYFDSSTSIIVNKITGFEILGKSISNLTINEGATTNHYFTVTAPFTFYEQAVLIQFNGGIDDVVNSDGNALNSFTLSSVINNISEPATTTKRFVTTTGKSSNGGTNDTTDAWNLQAAFSKAQPGTTVWIKAGDYGNTPITTQIDGTASKPIKFVGYTNQVGDISTKAVDQFTNYKNQKNSIIDSSVYPVIRGVNLSGSRGIELRGVHFVLFKNIQVVKFEENIRIGAQSGLDSKNLVFDNITVADGWDAADLTKSSGLGIVVDWSKDLSNKASTAENITIKNTLSFDNSVVNILVDGIGVLVENCKAYSGISTDQRDTDYYIKINKSGYRSVVRKSSSIRVGNLIHSGSGGIGGKASGGGEVKYCLFEDNFVKNIGGAYFMAWSNAHHSVFKNNSYTNDPSVGTHGNGLVARDGAHDNIFENNFIKNTRICISVYKDTEELQTAGYASLNNTFRNNIFKNYQIGIMTTNKIAAVQTLKGIKVYNNTFYNGSRDFFQNTIKGGGVVFSGNEFTNNIVKDFAGTFYINVTSKDFNQTYNNYHATPVKPAGIGNRYDDPLFENPSNDNFRLRVGSPLIDKGLKLNNVNSDFEGNTRSQGSSHEMGAFEFKDNSTGSVNANAGADTVICVGESTTLNASGGSSYVWSNGETTASIIVSPAATTTYTVTVSDGITSDTDDVNVTVNEAPSVNVGADLIICSGESVTLTAAGVGNFLWSTGETTSSITVSPNSTTAYTVTASNSCSDVVTDEVIVNLTPGVNLTLVSDVEICLDESITLTAQSNGDFLWNTGEITASITVSPASTTIYSVTSSLGDCSKTEEVSVTVNQATSVNAGSDQTICSGEEVILTANGEGNFLWSTGETTSSITVSPTSTTTYTVTASNSCMIDATDQVIVTVNDKPTITVSEDITIAIGSSTNLIANGEGSFLWNTGETTAAITVSPDVTTVYSVTLTSAPGCEVQESVEVIVENTSTPDDSGTTVTADAGEDVYVCLNSSTELTATGGGLYLWSTGEITATITVSPTETTTYYVTVSDGSDIDRTDVDEVTVYVNEGCSDLVNRPTTEEFKVYPNPTNGILHMELSGYSNELNLSLFSSTGKIIHSEIISNYSLDKALKRNINLRKFGKGIYYARIVNNGNNETKKVIVM